MNISIALVYLGFFGLIAYAVYFTDSAMPLWVLLLTPEYKSEK